MLAYSVILIGENRRIYCCWQRAVCMWRGDIVDEFCQSYAGFDYPLFARKSGRNVGELEKKL